MMERPRPQSKVSLEDLLRLKRAERPDPEFWAEFESQLRHKQLAAIVDKRPWWSRISSAGLAKISLSVGATAVIAFTLITGREQALAPASDGSLAGTGPLATANELSARSSELASVEQSAASDHNPAVEAAVSHTDAGASTVLASTPASTSRAASPTSGESSEPSLAQVILGIDGMTDTDALPRYRSEEPVLVTTLDILGHNQLPAVAVAAVEAPAVSHVAVPRDDRRARLLASIDSSERDLVAGNSRVARSRERIANRLMEQSLSDSISRLGLNGDSVSIKF